MREAASLPSRKTRDNFCQLRELLSKVYVLPETLNAISGRGGTACRDGCIFWIRDSSRAAALGLAGKAELALTDGKVVPQLT